MASLNYAAVENPDPVSRGRAVAMVTPTMLKHEELVDGDYSTCQPIRQQGKATIQVFLVEAHYIQTVTLQFKGKIQNVMRSKNE